MVTVEEQADLLRWLVRNILTEEQKDIIPPSFDKKFREMHFEYVEKKENKTRNLS